MWGGVLNPEVIALRLLTTSVFHFRGYLSTTGREKRGGKRDRRGKGREERERRKNGSAAARA